MFGDPRSRIGQSLVPALVASVQSIRLIALNRLPDAKLVTHIPDDAFYYLVMGRNFARLRRWTFDGVEPASGFHLLWGYLIAGLYWIRPATGLHEMFVVLGVIQIACLTVAAWLMCETARRIFGQGAEGGVAIIFLSTIALQMGLAMMETALVVLASAAVLNLILRRDEPVTTAALWGGVALGAAGMMARSDFGLLPLCLLGVQLVMLRRGFAHVRAVKLSACVLAGAVLGLGVVTLHTHWISGGWVQASAAQKLYWASLRGFSAKPVAMLLLRFFSIGLFDGNGSRRVQVAMLCAGSLLLLLLCAGMLRSMSKSAGHFELRRMAVGGLVLIVLAYVLLYRFDTVSLGSWYIAAFQAPVAVLAGAGTAWFTGRMRVLSAVMALAACTCGVWLSQLAPWPWLNEFYDCALYLRAHPELQPVGAWNTGVLAYFSGFPVVNLDGLVNDRILPHARAGTLLEYIQQRDLDAIADFNFMFTPGVAHNGGYADGRLERCVIQNATPTSEVWVFALRPECRPK